MKGKILSGALAAALMLTGCASLLNREYGSVEPHSATLVSDGDANTLRAESYQDVVNGLIYFINQGAESGSIRFEGEEPDVRALLDEACLEVVQEDPLGAYAVEYIKYNVAPIVGSYEADVHITYRRSREQVAAITDATGASAIRSELSEALAAFSPEVVLRISYFEEDEAYLRQLVREAYLSDPASALGMPEAEIAMYPASGPRRIVEILLAYPKPREILESQRNSLRREAERLAGQSIGLEDGKRLEQLSGLAGKYDQGGGSTAYDALLGSGADSQGLALSFALLCAHAELNCMVVDGQLNGTAHQWNVVETVNGWRHVDLTQGGSLRFWTDGELTGAGYTWRNDLVPQCGEVA
ncbi:MAG: hypothetical protein KH338_01475 [Oscillospiraceae bacterium]|nr:hypothetical protein [Oscillospiraceae bacterium]